MNFKEEIDSSSMDRIRFFKKTVPKQPGYFAFRVPIPIENNSVEKIFAVELFFARTKFREINSFSFGFQKDKFLRNKFATDLLTFFCSHRTN